MAPQQDDRRPHQEQAVGQPESGGPRTGFAAMAGRCSTAAVGDAVLDRGRTWNGKMRATNNVGCAVQGGEMQGWVMSIIGWRRYGTIRWQGSSERTKVNLVAFSWRVLGAS